MSAFGKRKTLIWVNLLGLGGVLITLVQNLITICAGRLIFGFSVGVLQVVGTSFLVETMPSSMMGFCGPYVNILINVGILVGSIMALAIPTVDSADFLGSESWRYIFAAPALMQIVAFILLLTVYPQESINLEAAYKNRID